ncbi:uncharacterized protein BDZ99DRAFT_513778 [Mytilinidion resinicola]|uniref:2EXR domain-containing protein n=1 Tax=Mytilinidion resinicola TaxID=574789 RepID=A0A6A6Z9Q3_9PEZI|nr:uncharacterized protein BDZ99DRAFT_513778 [Mytilinidion resinicola]KAF2817538.1 hypothetical protein BDZ99DRAFT_513778 [Mytilinidion resinicola]
MVGAWKAQSVRRAPQQDTRWTGRMATSTLVPSFVPGSLALYKGRTMRTRGFDRAVRQTFRFLDLPAEMRLMVYGQVLTFDGVSGYLTEMARHCYSGIGGHPLLSMTTPALFLVCKQITGELSNELRKVPLVLPNIFGVDDLTKVITPNILRNLEHVTISIQQFDEDQYFMVNMRSLERIAEDLSRVWEFGGNSLKKLTVRLHDDRISAHFKLCPPTQCYLREEIDMALSEFSSLRNIKDVSFEGILSDFEHSAHIASAMEIPTNYQFMELPQSIRKRIYDYSLDYNEAMDVMAKVIKQKAILSSHARKSKNATKIPREKIHHVYSPAILRLNKEIRAEAMEVLHEKGLTISAVTPKKHKITEFISAATLHNVRNLTLRISERTLGQLEEWNKVKLDLGKNFREKNSLESVKIDVICMEGSNYFVDVFMKVFMNDVKEQFALGGDDFTVEHNLHNAVKSPNTRGQSKKRPREDQVLTAMEGIC